MFWRKRMPSFMKKYLKKKSMRNQNKIHVQFCFKLLDLVQTSSTKTVHDDITDFNIK